jgi:hypothetical protein
MPFAGSAPYSRRGAGMTASRFPDQQPTITHPRLFRSREATRCASSAEAKTVALPLRSTGYSPRIPLYMGLSIGLVHQNRIVAAEEDLLQGAF